MLGVIEDIICWLDYTPVNLLSLGLIRIWYNLLLFEDFINLLKRTFVIAVSREKLLLPCSFRVTTVLHGASPKIWSSSSPSRHLLQLIQFLTSLLRSNLQIDMLPVVSVKILGGDLIILTMILLRLSHLIFIINGIILFATLGGRSNDA